MTRSILTKSKCVVVAATFATIIVSKFIMSEIKQARLNQAMIRPIDF